MLIVIIIIIVIIVIIVIKFELGFIKCKSSLNTHKTELVHCKLNLLNLCKFDVWGGVGLCGPHLRKKIRSDELDYAVRR